MPETVWCVMNEQSQVRCSTKVFSSHSISFSESGSNSPLPPCGYTSLQSSFILRILSIRKAAAMITLHIIAGGYTVIAIDKKLFEIAAKHMVTVQERGDLEARHCDSEDFIEIPVWGLEAALKDAYEAGRKSK